MNHQPCTINHPSSRAFTLIELLAVCTIIAVLAGLVIGVASVAQRKGASSEAQTAIKTMEGAIENFRLDNGAYPTSTTVRGSTTIEAGTNSWLLYRQITLGSNTAGKVYITPTSKQIQTSGTITYFLDPYGNPYNYYCSTLSSQTNKVTFDIWSFGADGSDSTYDDLTNWK